MTALVENSSPDFVVHFTEDTKGFSINGRKCSPPDPGRRLYRLQRFITGE
jgi:hypothetical protein